MEYLAMYGGLVVGALIFRIERRLKMEPAGVLLLVYLVGLFIGSLIGS